MTYEEQQKKLKRIRDALQSKDIEVGEYNYAKIGVYEFTDASDTNTNIEIILAYSLNKYQLSFCAGNIRLADTISLSLEEITDVQAFAQEVRSKIEEMQQRAIHFTSSLY